MSWCESRLARPHSRNIRILSYYQSFLLHFHFLVEQGPVRGIIASNSFRAHLQRANDSCNSFGKPVKCIGTTSSLQIARYKYPDKPFKLGSPFGKIKGHLNLLQPLVSNL